MVMARESRRADGRRDEDDSPRRADAGRNIAIILATALELFGRSDAVSMADVARAAGLGRVTVYAHFPSRADLLEALVAHAIYEAEQVMDRCLTDSQDVADRVLADLIGSAWHLLNRYRRLRTHAMATLGTERLDRHHDPVRQRVEQLLIRGQEQGVCLPHRPARRLDGRVCLQSHPHRRRRGRCRQNGWGVRPPAADLHSAGRAATSTGDERR